MQVKKENSKILQRTVIVLTAIPFSLIIVSIEKAFYLPMFLLLVSLSFFLNIELHNIIKIKNIKSFPILNIILSVGVLFGFYLSNKSNSSFILPIFLIAPFIIISIRIVIFNIIKDSLSILSMNLFSVFWSGILPGYLLLIRNLDNGFYFIMLFFFIIWTGDTFAYITGISLGDKKHKLPFKASPKKSIEGTIAGIISSIILGILVTLLFRSNTCLNLGITKIAFKNAQLSIIEIVLIAFLTNIAGQFGDLLESTIKRDVNIKDANSLLTIPGHGGFLDRLDSLFFSAPVFYFLLAVMGKL